MHVSRWSFALSTSLLLSSPLFAQDQPTDRPLTPAPYACGAIPVCDATPPALGPGEGFVHKAPRGNPFHRGFDQLFAEGEDQWVVGRFSYGNFVARGELKGERIDIYLLRGCGTTWQKLASVQTSEQKNQFPSVEGIDDREGQIVFKIPDEQRLELGRHRLRLVVAGDRTAADLYIEVLPQGSPLFVSDVDGTLTTSEFEELGSVIAGNKLSEANPFAASELSQLVAKGYRPYYLTARAENLFQRTREFLEARQFPVGAVETSQAGLLGLTGGKAVNFKTAAIKRLEARGFAVIGAFGNTKTDAEAYANAGIPVGQRYFYRFDDEVFGGRRIESYEQLGDFAEVADLCKP